MQEEYAVYSQVIYICINGAIVTVTLLSMYYFTSA